MKVIVCKSCGDQISACDNEECGRMFDDGLICFPGNGTQGNKHFCDSDCMYTALDRNAIFTTYEDETDYH